MKTKNLLSLALLTISLGAANLSKAQTNTAFAITGETKGNFFWTAIREVDLSTGSVVRNIYIPSTDKVESFDALTGASVLPPSAAPENSCFQNMIAAAAYDAKNNRLYFTHIKDSQLGYFDLNSSTPKVYYVQDQSLKPFTVLPGEDDNITRMVFAADGFGYALTNDGEHLMKFNTGAKINITDLGSLKDDINNADNSVHKAHDNWGGDMIADAFGNLYLIGVAGNVFKINTQTLVASFMGTIKGLPKDYTVNAAAVDANGQIVVSSALDASNYYSFDLGSFQAAPIAKAETQVYNASDFANGNLAYQKQVNGKTISGLSKIETPTISIYPNPVQNKTLNISFNNFSSNKRSIEVSTITGQNVLSKEIDAFSKNQSFTLPQNLVPGVYVVKVLTDDNETYTTKIVVE